jgi:hypothetical protein
VTDSEKRRLLKLCAEAKTTPSEMLRAGFIALANDAIRRQRFEQTRAARMGIDYESYVALCALPPHAREKFIALRQEHATGRTVAAVVGELKDELRAYQDAMDEAPDPLAGLSPEEAQVAQGIQDEKKRQTFIDARRRAHQDAQRTAKKGK